MIRRSFLLGLLILCCARAPDRFVYLDLTQALSDSLVRGVDARVYTMRQGTTRYRGILVPGNGSFRARLSIPPSPMLTFTPMRPPALEMAASGEILFSVTVRTRGSLPDTIWQGQIGPSDHRGDAVKIDLSRFSGATIEFEFSARSTGHEDPSASWAVWAKPRILSRSRPRGSSNLLLITIDTLRADHVGCYGDSLARTPRLDRVAKSGAIFLNMFTNFNVTNPSLATLFTGLYGRDHGVYDLRTPLAGQFVTMAEILKGAGYATGAVVGVHHLDPALSGLHQGFDDYLAPSTAEWKAEVVTELANDWLSAHREERLFLWVHYFDPHMLYDPPHDFAQLFSPNGPELQDRRNLADSLSSIADLTHLGPVGLRWLKGISDPAYPEAMYRAEIAYTDQQVGRLLDHLKNLLLESKTLTVITADHGESITEHGIFFNHIGIYEQQLHVPLIFHSPGLVPPGKRLDGLISAVDLCPTILDLLTTALPLESGGFSFAPTLLTDAPGPRNLVIAQHADNRAATVRSKGWSLISSWLPYSVVHVDTLFFDLENDPNELTDMSASDIRAPRILAELQEWKERASPFPATPVPLDEETRERLISLGYAIND